MTKLADKIRDELKPRLEPDEELRSVGYVASGPLTSGAAYWLTSGVAQAATSYFWYVGITQRRAIFLRVKRVRAPGTSDVSTWFATPLKNVEFDNKGMALVVPEEGMAQSFIFGSLNRKQNGLDIDEFKLALSTGLDGGGAGHRGALGDRQLGPADDQGVAESPAAWHPDPTGRHAHRYRDGLSWTPHVADAGAASHDPADAASATTDATVSARRNPASAVTLPGLAGGARNGVWSGAAKLAGRALYQTDGAFSVEGSGTVGEQFLKVHQARGQIAWSTPEIRAWAHELF